MQCYGKWNWAEHFICLHEKSILPWTVVLVHQCWKLHMGQRYWIQKLWYPSPLSQSPEQPQLAVFQQGQDSDQSTSIILYNRMSKYYLIYISVSQGCTVVYNISPYLLWQWVYQRHKYLLWHYAHIWNLLNNDFSDNPRQPGNTHDTRQNTKIKIDLKPIVEKVCLVLE